MECCENRRYETSVTALCSRRSVVRFPSCRGQCVTTKKAEFFSKQHQAPQLLRKMVLQLLVLQAGNSVSLSFLLMSSFLYISLCCSSEHAHAGLCLIAQCSRQVWGRPKLTWNAFKARQRQCHKSLGFVFLSTGIDLLAILGCRCF